MTHLPITHPPMTHEDSLAELLNRLAARRGAPVRITAAELQEWPAAAVDALKRHKLLVRAPPAKSAVCPGCEEACVQRVHSLRDTPHPARHFVLCDRRDDINRVQIPPDRLTQWQCTIAAVSAFVAAALGLRHHQPKAPTAHGWEIGLVQGRRRSQMLSLHATPDGCRLVVQANLLPLVELIRWRDGGFTLDRPRIDALIDAASAGDPRHTPSTARRDARKLDTQDLHADWQKTYRELKDKYPDQTDSWLSQKIAKTTVAQGRSASTIRKNMKG